MSFLFPQLRFNMTLNLHHFSNLHDNFLFDVILHRLSLVILIFCRRLAESDVTIMSSVIYGLITMVLYLMACLFTIDSIGFSYQHE
jgi:hypothetical protein